MDHRLDKHLDQQDRDMLIMESQRADWKLVQARELEAKAIVMWQNISDEWDRQESEYQRGLRSEIDYAKLNEMKSATLEVQAQAERLRASYHRELYRKEMAWLKDVIVPLTEEPLA